MKLIDYKFSLYILLDSGTSSDDVIREYPGTMVVAVFDTKPWQEEDIDVYEVKFDNTPGEGAFGQRIWHMLPYSMKREKYLQAYVFARKHLTKEKPLP